MWLLLGLACSSSTKQPDIILLTIDTLRFDHISALATDSPVKTPFIDSLAKDGVVYEQAYSPISITGPAFLTLHTGIDPAEHKVRMNLFRGGTSLDPKVETMAQLLREQEYQTAAFVSGFTLHPKIGLRKGFQHYRYPINASRIEAKKTVKNTLRWLTKTKKTRLLWYHSYDPHGPLHVWGPWQTKKSSSSDLEKIPQYQRIEDISDPQVYQQLYAKAVAHSDKLIGRIIKKLKKQKRYDNAMIVFTSDHGESFTERELWFDHGTEASEEQLHIPLIIKYPKQQKAGTKESRLVALKDIFPTVLEVVDGKQRNNSLLRKNHSERVLMGESSHCKRISILSCAPRGPLGKVYSLRNSTHTLVRKTSNKGVTYAYYNRNKDLIERNPLPDEPPKALKEKLDTFASQGMMMMMNVAWPPANQRSRQQQMLRSLGYIDDED